MTRPVGEFYVIQVIPEFAPGRVKLGWSSNLKQRLSSHRAAAPTASLAASWPCHFSWEMVAMRDLPCGPKIRAEVFDCPDITELVRSAELFFGAGDRTTPRPLPVLLPPPPKPPRVYVVHVPGARGRNQGVIGHQAPRLNEWRSRRRLPMRVLAEKAGIAISTIYRLEKGGDATLTTIGKLAEALGIEPDQLYGEATS